MESNKKLGLIGMLFGIGSAAIFLVTLFWLAVYHGSIPSEVAVPLLFGLYLTGTILAVGGLILSLTGLMKGSSGFAIVGIIVSIVMLVIYIIFWAKYIPIWFDGGLP